MRLGVAAPLWKAAATPVWKGAAAPVWKGAAAPVWKGAAAPPVTLRPRGARSALTEPLLGLGGRVGLRELADQFLERAARRGESPSSDCADATLSSASGTLGLVGHASISCRCDAMAAL